jgi:Ca2+-binding RTX toxin-like protein
MPTNNLDYSLTVSPWGAGAPEKISYSYDLIFSNAGSASENFGGSAGLDVLGVEVFEGGFDLGFNADWSLAVGLRNSVELQIGSVSIDYSIDVDESVSDALTTLNTNSFIDTKNWSVTNSEFSSTGTDPDNSKAEVYAIAKVAGGLSLIAGGYAEVFDSTVFREYNSYTIIPSFAIDKSVLLAGIYPGDGILEKEFNFGSIEFTLPSTPELETLDLVSSANGYGSLTAKDVGDPFVTATLDIAKAITDLTGVPLSGEWPLDPYPLDITFGWTIFGAKLIGEFALQQQLDFVPGDVDIKMVSTFSPTVDTQGVTLILGETVAGKLGDKFLFTTPQGEGSFSVSAEYVLDAKLINTLTLYGKASFELSFLEASIDASVDFGFEGGDFDIADESFSFYSHAFDIVEGPIYSFPSITQQLNLPVLTRQYTITYENFYIGTNGNDTFTMTTHQQFADGKAGNDRITGNLLDNEILGGSDGDTLIGLAGNDTLNGGEGADSLQGGQGFDMASYAGATSGVFADLLDPSRNKGDAKGDAYNSIQGLTGSSNNDDLWGDKDANRLEGGLGADTLRGRDGTDTLVGGGGADTLFGDGGDDRFLFLEPQDGGDEIFGLSVGDQIGLQAAGFGLLPGTTFVEGVNFFAGKGAAPTSVIATLIYDAKSNLYFDPDGTGSQGPIYLANLHGATLRGTDLFVF